MSRLLSITLVTTLVAGMGGGISGCGSPESTTTAAPVPPAPASAATGSTTLAATTAAPATTTSPATTRPPSTTSTAGPSSTTSIAPTTSTTNAPPPTDPAGIDPGTLPQTRDKPAASSPLLDEHARALWQAIAKDDPALAMPFFFPKAAYLQVKDIDDPGGDYEQRLVAAYEEDIHALHQRLGNGAATSAFAGFTVAPDVRWIDPGAEYNKLGYWRVYGSKLAYSASGKRQEVPIASLISWRGQWYVVHLNSIR